ncbi:hydrolase [Ralstonia pickettii DTP0602]|nr:hydrolase [Ralstonia pickettii DTP0602]
MPPASPFPADAETPLGAHLVTPRHGYAHHGIYAGNGKVVHYAGYCHRQQRGPVEELSLDAFVAGHGTTVLPTPMARYGAVKTVRRARSRVGEDRYRLLTNNCEHFCTWCLYCESRSEQVRHCVTHPLSGLRLAASMLSCGGRRRPATRGTVSPAWTQGNGWLYVRMYNSSMLFRTSPADTSTLHVAVRARSRRREVPGSHSPGILRGHQIKTAPHMPNHASAPRNFHPSGCGASTGYMGVHRGAGTGVGRSIPTGSTGGSRISVSTTASGGGCAAGGGAGSGDG